MNWIVPTNGNEDVVKYGILTQCLVAQCMVNRFGDTGSFLTRLEIGGFLFDESR
jgi:hypothetical protein